MVVSLWDVKRIAHFFYYLLHAIACTQGHIVPQRAEDCAIISDYLQVMLAEVAAGSGDAEGEALGDVDLDGVVCMPGGRPGR